MGGVDMSDEKRYKDNNEEGKTYVDGQPREIKSKKDKEDNMRNPLTWVAPIMVIILIVPLLLFHIGGGGEGGEGEDGDDGGGEPVATDESSEEDSEGEESGSEEADSGDVDAEGVARDNCASCHGEDFSGEMGPALDGTELAEEEFETIVREGQGSMPSFDDGQVSDEELTAMYDFFTE